jgi:hypothetical protein
MVQGNSRTEKRLFSLAFFRLVSVQLPRQTTVFDGPPGCPEVVRPIAEKNTFDFNAIGEDIRRPERQAFSDTGRFGL